MSKGEFISFERGIRDDIGFVTLTLAPEALSDVLGNFDVKEVRDTPLVVLQALCIFASSEYTSKFIEHFGKETPAKLYMDGDRTDITDVNGLESDLHFKLHQAELDDKCDPRTNRVLLELRMFEDTPEPEPAPGRQASRLILSRLLEPGDF